MKLFYYLLIILLTGCAKTAPQNKTIDPYQEITRYAADIEHDKSFMISHEDLFLLPEQEKKKIIGHMISKPDGKTRYNHLYNYLEQKLSNFNYYGDTFTAAESVYKKGGNCLSLAILTAAYAELVDVKYDFDLVSSSPVYLQEGKLDLISNHVRTKLYATQTETKGQLFSQSAGIIVDYFPATKTHKKHSINNDYFISLYYQNLASKALMQNHHQQALTIAKQGVAISPENLNLLNILAISLSRLERLKQAENLYQLGLKTAPQDLNLLVNYRILARKLKNDSTVSNLTARINESNDPTPFTWLHLAENAYKNNHNTLAINYFLKAAKFAPYLTNAHQGLGRAYLKSGDLSKAKHAFEKALESTHDDTLEQMYATKISKLQLFLNKHTEQ